MTRALNMNWPTIPQCGDIGYYRIDGETDLGDRGRVITVDGGLAVRWDRDHRVDRLVGAEICGHDGATVAIARRTRTRQT